MLHHRAWACRELLLGESWGYALLPWSQSKRNWHVFGSVWIFLFFFSWDKNTSNSCFSRIFSYWLWGSDWNKNPWWKLSQQIPLGFFTLWNEFTKLKFSVLGAENIFERCMWLGIFIDKEHSAGFNPALGTAACTFNSIPKPNLTQFYSIISNSSIITSSDVVKLWSFPFLKGWSFQSILFLFEGK